MRAEPCQRHRRRARRASPVAPLYVVQWCWSGRTASVRPSLPPVGLSLCCVPLLQALRRARDVAEDCAAEGVAASACDAGYATGAARERRWRRAAAVNAALCWRLFSLSHLLLVL